jgi:hypothetical protein
MTDAERRWESGWEGHELAQRERRAALPFTVKLEWLEDAHRLVLALRPQDRDGKSDARSMGNAVPGTRPLDP